MKKVLVSLALLLPAVGMAQAPVIEISGANFRPLPIAVTAPKTEDPAAKRAAAQFDQALLFDLGATGVFQVLDRKSFLADPHEGMNASDIHFDRWINVGADALVKVDLRSKGDQLMGELRLFTVASGTRTFEKRISGPLNRPRRLAHAFADALYEKLTKEPGPFESQLAFVRKTAQGKDVWISDWDGRNAQALTRGGINLLPVLLPKGGGAAYTSYLSGRPEVYSQKLGGKPELLVRAGQMVTGIDYSPDGKRIAYAVGQGKGAQIWVARADGRHRRRLTHTPYFLNTSPCWSPDGKRIAFVSNRGGSPQIYIMDASGKHKRRLTFKGNYNQTPSWSPRGDLIAFTARDEHNDFDIFTVEVDSGKIVRLTQDQGNNEEPSFSPNGRLVVFSSTRTGHPRLFVTTLDGNHQVALPMDKGAFTTPDWGR